MRAMRTILAGGLLLPALGAFAAEPIESDWLELVKGYKGAAMGAEVTGVDDDEDVTRRRVTIAIPKTAINNPNEIEEVVVVGRRPEAPDKPEPMDITFEWVDDYDNDNYGLVIRLGRDTNWPIRLFMNSGPGFTR